MLYGRGRRHRRSSAGAIRGSWPPISATALYGWMPLSPLPPRALSLVRCREFRAWLPPAQAGHCVPSTRLGRKCPRLTARPALSRRVRKPLREEPPGTNPHQSRLDGRWVPASRYWGAQTERSLHPASTSAATRLWGRPIMRPQHLKVAALANAELKRTDIAGYIRAGRRRGHLRQARRQLPTSVDLPGPARARSRTWCQHGSSPTRAIELAGGTMGTQSPCTPMTT